MSEYSDIVSHVVKLDGHKVIDRAIDLGDSFISVGESVKDMVSGDIGNIRPRRVELVKKFYNARFLLDVIFIRYGIQHGEWEKELLEEAKKYLPVQDSLDDLEF